MKVRFTARGVRVRLDDLEVERLCQGEVLTLALSWPGGGWEVSLNPGKDGLQAQAGRLEAGLAKLMPRLLAPAHEGVTLHGPPHVDVEKDFGPQHG